MSAVLTTPRAPSRPPARSMPSGRPALLLPPRAEPPAVGPEPALLARLSVTARAVGTTPAESLWTPDPGRPRPEAALPDPRTLCGPLVLAAVEALHGARPLAQLTRWVTPEIHAALEERVTRTPGPRRRATVLRTATQVSATGAEAAVVVHDGYRVRAAALRLQVHRAHWRATVLQIG